MSFRRGDVILVTENVERVSGQWLMGCLAGDENRRGFVPGNFLADMLSDDPKLLPGFYDISRPDAEKELVRPAHQVGASCIAGTVDTLVRFRGYWPRGGF